MKNIVLIIILITIFGCKDNIDKKKLKEYESITRNFNASEINDLCKIISFFEFYICKDDYVFEDRDDCYKKYFENLKKTVKHGYLDVKIPLEEQRKLFNKLQNSTINKIWSNYKLNDSIIFKYLKNEGRYIDFLKLFGNENKKIQQYVDNLIISDEISPVMVSDIILNYKDYNLRDERTKLLIVIHYLTLIEREVEINFMR